MATKKILNDKYYTSPETALYCFNKAVEVIGKDNITEFIESSAGNGVFLDIIEDSGLDIPYRAYDIEPEDNRIIKQDFLKLELEYMKGRCIGFNFPYGSKNNLSKSFANKSFEIADYVCSILPISQLNNTQSIYKFDLIYSEDLKPQLYSDVNVHCCFNIYKKPISGKFNTLSRIKLNSIEIVRHDSVKYKDFNFDIRMCYWGDGSAGKILKDNEKYSAEYKIKIHNEEVREEVVHLLNNTNWKNILKKVAMIGIRKFDILNYLKEQIPSLT